MSQIKLTFILFRMVRKYIRKTQRANWNEDQMRLAISAVEKKEMSTRKSVEEKHKNVLGRYRAALTHDQEKVLENHITMMNQVFYGLSINDIRALVYEYCEKNNINNNLAGRDFVNGFLKRHPKLSLRKPESISMNRVFGLNRVSVNRYFGNLKTVVDKRNFKPHEIFNCDESGLTCVHKPVKVLAPKGKRTVSSTTSGELGQMTTYYCCCMHAVRLVCMSHQ